MDYNSPPGPPTDPYIDPDELNQLNRLFDGLVLSFEEADAAERALGQWQAENPYPQAPKSFEGTKELAEYRQVRASYERDLAVLAQRRDDTRRAHLQRAEEFVDIIPRDSSLDYQDSRGRRYGIAHRSDSNEQPVIVFRRG